MCYPVAAGTLTSTFETSSKSDTLKRSHSNCRPTNLYAFNYSTYCSKPGELAIRTDTSSKPVLMAASRGSHRLCRPHLTWQQHLSPDRTGAIRVHNKPARRSTIEIGHQSSQPILSTLPYTYTCACDVCDSSKQQR
jgi:hypothetical protein